jgi:hypothetical protein
MFVLLLSTSLGCRIAGLQPRGSRSRGRNRHAKSISAASGERTSGDDARFGARARTRTGLAVKKRERESGTPRNEGNP